MLSPEYLDEIEFNKVVELYNKLNIDITSDIIRRISKMDYITETSKKQLEILLETNGMEIFNEALEETSMLTAETKRVLKAMFEDMAKEDLESYEELYEYRNKPFKLNQTQYKILNQGLKQTSKTLKNFTSTIAFQSKQMYVNAIDEAYMKVVSGAFDYNTAITQAVERLANQGITLKDKLGRNVQLEVAVRRNVMGGIQETANNINRDVEEYLGCDGYEVSAHIGARPTHAEEQGKQFALTKEKASKYGVGLWSDVEELWQEYNCRHSYSGIILGVSEPTYTKKDLEYYKNATVTLNGKKVPYYEATQKQRALENDIRKAKRSVQILEKAGFDNKAQKMDLAKLNKKYTDFCKETGLQKDYSRIRIANYNSTNNKNSSIINTPLFSRGLLNKNSTIHSKSEMKKIADETFKIANKYTTNESKWKGKINISNRNVNAKLWNCKIEIEATATGHEMLHEQLHAHSISYYNRDVYKEFRRIEEATVELFTKEICKKENIINVKSNYDVWVNDLRKINNILKIEKNDFDFAKRLFEIPVTKRIEFLDNEIQKYIIGKNIDEIMEISQLIEVFYGK